MKWVQKITKWAFFIFTVWGKHRREMESLIMCMNNERQLAADLLWRVKNGKYSLGDLENYLSPKKMADRFQVVQDLSGVRDDIGIMYNKMIDEQEIRKVRLEP